MESQRILLSLEDFTEQIEAFSDEAVYTVVDVSDRER